MLLITAHLVGAQALSPGCANTGSSFLNGTFTSNSATFGASFNAGEVLTFQVSGAAPAVFQLSQGAGVPLTSITATPVSGALVFSYTVAAGGFRLFEVAETGGSAITVSASCGLPGAGGSGGVLAVVAPPCANVFDGRINNDTQLDCGAPVAIYTGSVSIYSIDPNTSLGVLSLRLTADELAAVDTPAANTLLAQAVNPFTGQPVSVYVLASGELQVNAFYADGKPYTVVWPASQPSALYHLDW
jgi:hypothetical protein